MGEMHDLYGRWDTEGTGYVPDWLTDDPSDYSGWHKGELARLEIRYAAGEWLSPEEFRVIARARQKAVARALRSGRLQKGPCEECGSTEDVQAHHHSYLREDALDVTWLCLRCHFEQRYGEPYKGPSTTRRR
jgi:hypothetical protein